jgi:hypothetical protein
MKHPFITFAILLVAALLYGLGLAGLGVVALIVGGVFELWFWVRPFSRLGHVVLSAGFPRDSGWRQK